MLISELITTLVLGGFFALFLWNVWTILEWRDERRKFKTDTAADHVGDAWSLWFGRDRASVRVRTAALSFIFAVLILGGIVKGLPLLLADMGVL